MLLVIILQVRSPLGDGHGVADSAAGPRRGVPTLLFFDQPFGFNAILGLIGLAGILMRNTLILIGQIRTNQQQGLTPITPSSRRRSNARGP